MVKNTETSSTLLRGMAILQQVMASPRPLSVADLVAGLQLPKPSVHRIALQLEAAGYLQRQSLDKRFSVGPSLKQLAMGILSNDAVGAPRHAILEALSAEVGETCNCTMLDGNRLIYFDRVESNWPIKIHLHPGSRLPLHATASGKLFLAYMKPQTRKRLLNAAPLSQYTEHTYTNPQLLEQALQRIKQEGVGYDNEELLIGMVAIAVPVFDHNQRMCFTIAIHAPTARKSLEDLKQFLPALHRSATALAECYCIENSRVAKQ